MVCVITSKLDDVGGGGEGAGDEPDGFLHATKKIIKTKVKMHLITFPLFLASLMANYSLFKKCATKIKGCNNDSLLKNIMHPLCMNMCYKLQPVALQSVQRHDFICAQHLIEDTKLI